MTHGPVPPVHVVSPACAHPTPRRPRRPAAAQVALTLCALAAVPSADAATIAVACGGGDPAPLVHAVTQANADADADVLVLSAGCTYTLTALGGLPVTTPITVLGNGAIVERSAATPPPLNDPPDFRLFKVEATGQLSIDRLTLRNAYARQGGAVHNEGTLVLSNSVVSDNFASNGGGLEGGGLYNTPAGRMAVTASTFLRNRSTAGGAIVNEGLLEVADSSFRGNRADFGAGIHNTGTATVARSTFSGSFSDDGGGLINGGPGMLTVANSTVSGSAGGAAIATAGGSVVVTGSTLAHNGPVTSTHVGGVYVWGGSMTLRGTIIVPGAGTIACFGPVTDGGGNLATDATCPAGFLQADPLLGPLQNHGGPTQTHPLQAGSPAIDAIAPSVCTLATDQRGVPRPQGPACDIGAFESRVGNARFAGFFSPVDNPPVVNVVNAGRGIPVKFSLGGDFGLQVFAGGFPASRQVPCEGGVPSDVVEETVTAGGSGLQFDPASLTYLYVWATQKAWAGTCRGLTLRLDNGSEHLAVFRFR